MDARDLLKMVDDRAVAAWADDLLEAEDEAELPARAYRRPVIMAASVEAGASTSKQCGCCWLQAANSPPRATACECRHLS